MILYSPLWIKYKMTNPDQSGFPHGSLHFTSSHGSFHFTSSHFQPYRTWIWFPRGSDIGRTLVLWSHSQTCYSSGGSCTAHPWRHSISSQGQAEVGQTRPSLPGPRYTGTDDRCPPCNVQTKAAFLLSNATGNRPRCPPACSLWTAVSLLQPKLTRQVLPFHDSGESWTIEEKDICGKTYQDIGKSTNFEQINIFSYHIFSANNPFKKFFIQFTCTTVPSCCLTCPTLSSIRQS